MLIDDYGGYFTVASVGFLLVFSAFFSGSETALTVVSRAKIHQLAENGSESAKKIIKLIEKNEYLIGGILLGNNLVNILATSLATTLLIRLFGDSGVAIATLGMTCAILIFAEVLPKTYAINHPETAALKIASIMTVLMYILKPLAFVINYSVTAMLRFMHVELSQKTNLLAAHDELRGAISLHHSQGAFVKDSRDMLLGALDLNHREVSDVMHHRKDIFMIDANKTPVNILDSCLRSPHTRVPLYKTNKENIIGVLHIKDLLCTVNKLTRGAGESAEKLANLDIMAIAMEPWFIPNTTTLSQQLRAFLKKRQHFALVVDEYGVLQGLITLEDILEEIVGEIVDEHDLTSDGIEKEFDGSFLIPGSTPIRDIKRLYDWKLPEEEATTIAGLVIHKAQCIPNAGQVFFFDNFRFEVVEKRRHQLTKIRVKTTTLHKKSPTDGSESTP
jgi:Mg2+/Co2+ transporter CorB